MGSTAKRRLQLQEVLWGNKMNKKNLSFSMVFKSVTKSILFGAIAFVIWLAISLLLMAQFSQTPIDSMLRIINYPLFYLIAGTIFDFLVSCEYINQHDFFPLIYIAVIVYLIAGSLFGLFCHFLWTRSKEE